MPRAPWSRLLPAALALVLVVGTVCADSIPWSYATFVFPPFVSPDAGGIVPAPGSPVFPGSVGINFQGTSGDTAGSSPIVFANWWTDAWGLTPGATATFAHQPIQLDIGILDKESNRSQVAPFTGYLDGTFSAGSANLSLSYAPQSQTLHIGATTYTINLGAMTLDVPGGAEALWASGPIHSWPSGTVEATVNASQTPEPSSLVLLGAGATLAGLLVRRLRRRA
jgi:hypothetical protein